MRYLGYYQRLDDHRLVHIMSDWTAHRGPDAAVTWEYEDDRVRPKPLSTPPLRAWVRHDLQGPIHDTLVRKEPVQSGMIRRQDVQCPIQEETDGREDRSKQVRQLLKVCRHTQDLGVAA